MSFLQVFAANSDRNTVVHNTLPYPINTRYVRIFEYAFEEWISFRVEFYGCPLPKTTLLPTLVPIPTNKPSATSRSTISKLLNVL